MVGAAKIGCLWIHQYHEVSSIIHFSHHFTQAAVCWMLLSQVSLTDHIVRLTAPKISQRHNFILSNFVHFSTRILLRHKNFIIREFQDRNYNIRL